MVALDRIRLRGLLRKSPAFAGLFYSQPIDVHHPCITTSSIEPSSHRAIEPSQSVHTEHGLWAQSLVELNPGASVSGGCFPRKAIAYRGTAWASPTDREALAPRPPLRNGERSAARRELLEALTKSSGVDDGSVRTAIRRSSHRRAGR